MTDTLADILHEIPRAVGCAIGTTLPVWVLWVVFGG